MRVAWLGLASILAACTAAAPPDPQPAAPLHPPVLEPTPELEPATAPQPGMELPLPPPGIAVVTGKLSPPTNERLQLHPLGGARALLLRSGPDGTSLALTTGPEGHVWSTPSPDLTAVTVVDDTIVVAAVSDRYPAAVAFDLASGAQLWQTSAPHAEMSKDRQAIEIEAGAGQVLHLLHDGPGHQRIMTATRARDGEVLGVVRGWIDHVVVSPRWVAVSERYGETGLEYTLRPRQDLTIAHPQGYLNDVCILDDRLYATRDRQIVRIDLAHLDRPEQRLLVDRATSIERCDRHGDEHILWLHDRVIGVDRTGAVAWSLGLDGLGFNMNHPMSPDLGFWRQPATTGLPDHAARLVRRDDKLSLLLVDLRLRRAREARLAAFWAGTLVHAGKHHVLLLRAKQTYALISIDGATGRVSAAVRVATDGDLELVSAGDASVWLYTNNRRMHLDAATLRPADTASAFTLLAVDEWARALDTAPAAAPPPPRVLPPLPPRPTPGRAASPTPAWDQGEIFAAAVKASGTPHAGTTGRLLTWDRQEEDDGGWAEHALVVLEHTRDPRTWRLALMRRSNRAVWAPWWDIENSDEIPGGSRLGLDPRSVGVWGVLDAPQSRPSIEILDHRPTTADLRSFLEHSTPWDPAGNYIGMNPNDPYTRAYLVDGNNIDAAWRDLTGEPPPLPYPPEIERRD